MKDNKLQKYQKTDKLGQGTYGVVYKALDNQTKQYVALKKIRLENQEEGIPSTAIRQISILKQLSHPNIVKLDDIIHSNKKLILVFEYVEYDLKKYMSKFKENGLNPILIKTFCFQLLKGIQHCHQKKILHRDLKPQNLLISENGVLKIADFGLARSSGIPTKGYTHEVVTLWYRPPDVLLGSQKYSDSIDIWSVGCILAEMITHRPLFPGQNQQNELNRIFQIFGTPNSKTWPGVQSLPQWNSFKFKEYPGNNLRKVVEKVDDMGYDLLQKMLQMNPQKRISANEALKHKYFDDIPKESLKIYQ